MGPSTCPTYWTTEMNCGLSWYHFVCSADYPPTHPNSRSCTPNNSSNPSCLTPPPPPTPLSAAPPLSYSKASPTHSNCPSTAKTSPTQMTRSSSTLNPYSYQSPCCLYSLHHHPPSASPSPSNSTRRINLSHYDCCLCLLLCFITHPHSTKHSPI